MDKKIIVFTCADGVELLLDGESFYAWDAKYDSNDVGIKVSEKFCTSIGQSEVLKISEGSDALIEGISYYG